LRLGRYGESGKEVPGLLDSNGVLRDLSDHIHDICGTSLAPESIDKIGNIDPATLRPVKGSPRFGPPVADVGKIICVGLNYRAHAAEAKMDVPDEPVLFTKATSAIIGPTDTIVLPKNARKADWEVEMVAVIGRRASYVETSDAMSHVAGFCLGNDLSERSFQLEGSGQWLKGKSADTFAPIGPWLVTPDDVNCGHDLDLWLDVDGTRHQDSNTRLMIFSVAEIVSFISQFMTLMPGDLIFTGTPPGVGLGQDPQIWLQPGAVLRCGISGLGEQHQNVVAWSPSE